MQIESSGPREAPQERGSKEEKGTMEKPQVSQHRAAGRPGGCCVSSSELDASHEDEEPPGLDQTWGGFPPSIMGQGVGWGRPGA